LDNVLFDVNICVYHSVGYPDAISSWDHYIIHNYDKYRIIMSTIQASELLSYPKVQTDSTIKSKREKYIRLADEIVPVTLEIALKAAELRRAWQLYNGKNLKTPDAIIAATALIYDAVLVSNNDRDFEFLNAEFGLKYENPILDQKNLHDFLLQFR
jgi:predicted nucleic acid-binding protein